MRGVFEKSLILLLLQQAVGAVAPETIFHDPADIFYVNPQAGQIRIRTARGSIEQATAVIGERPVNMTVGYRDKDHEYYVAQLNAFDSTLSYRFVVRSGTDSVLIPPEGGFRPAVPLVRVPNWSAGKTYYYICIDGFSNGDPSNDPEGKKGWGSAPEDWSPYGGDLKGILARMAYIDSLGPDVIILSPIFTARSNHKFNVADYGQIDPAYGDTNDLRRLIETVHATRKKIVLNIVLSHTSTDFPAFADVASRGWSSKYASWYRIQSAPSDSAGLKYRAWRSDPRFPLFNLRNRQLQDYLIGFIDYWSNFGFDGFYVGEPEEIDASFMSRLYDSVAQKKKGLIVIGGGRGVERGWTCDGCYDREFTKILVDYFVNKRITTAAFDSVINQTLFFNPPQRNSMNLVGFYEYTKRIGGIVDADALELMYAFIFTCCGSPLLLFGDEVRMRDCAPLNWGSFPWTTDQQDRAFLARIRSLVKLRKNNRELQSARFYTLYVDDVKRIYAYDRGGLITVLNCDRAPGFVELPAWDGQYLDLTTGEWYTAYSQTIKLSVEPMSYRILKRGT